MGTYVLVCESYTVARSVLKTNPFANFIRICVAFREHTRMRILYGYTYHTYSALGIFRMGILVSAYQLSLVNVWAELCSWRSPLYRSLEFSPFLSTHLRSNNSKKFVNYKQRALLSTDTPVPLTSYQVYISPPPLFTDSRKHQPKNTVRFQGRINHIYLRVSC